MKKLLVTGNVGQDAVVMASANGEFAKFSVAVSVGTKLNPRTDWVEVTCNGALLNVAKNYVKKGGKVLVEGFPQAHAYVNKEGALVTSLKVFAYTVELLTKAPSANDVNEVLNEVPDGSEVPF